MTATPSIETARSQAYVDDRAHVFHSWSAQAALDPLVVVGAEAARLITELAPGDLDMVFFTNGGAEATENAMRMARLHTGRHKVLTTYRSYHGATAGAILDDLSAAIWLPAL